MRTENFIGKQNNPVKPLLGLKLARCVKQMDIDK